jgi:hypothetical protein
MATMDQFTCSIYYYLRDLDWVHLACRGLPYGDRDQIVLIDDELCKALWNPKWSKLYLEPFKGHELSKNKVQWLNLASRLWLTLKGLPFAKLAYAYFIIIMYFSINIRLILGSNNLKEVKWKSGNIITSFRWQSKP